MLKENIYLQLFYTKMLNECKFQNINNAGKVKEKKIYTCIMVCNYYQLYRCILKYTHTYTHTHKKLYDFFLCIGWN